MKNTKINPIKREENEKHCYKTIRNHISLLEDMIVTGSMMLWWCAIFEYNVQRIQNN